MNWFSSFSELPAFYWQQLIMGLGLLIVFLAMLMSVKSRSRRARRRVI